MNNQVVPLGIKKLSKKQQTQQTQQNEKFKVFLQQLIANDDKLKQNIKAKVNNYRKSRKILQNDQLSTQDQYSFIKKIQTLTKQNSEYHTLLEKINQIKNGSEEDKKAHKEQFMHDYIYNVNAGWEKKQKENTYFLKDSPTTEEQQARNDQEEAFKCFENLMNMFNEYISKDVKTIQALDIDTLTYEKIKEYKIEGAEEEQKLMINKEINFPKNIQVNQNHFVEIKKSKNFVKRFFSYVFKFCSCGKTNDVDTNSIKKNTIVLDQ